MTRRDALIRVIEALHAEIDALKINDIAGLERATSEKLSAIDDVARLGEGPADAGLRDLAAEAHRLNETCRIYVNLMSANVRRRLSALGGTPVATYGSSAGAYA